MKLSLDTNAYSGWLRQGLWHEPITRAEEVLLSPIVLGELRDGFKGGRRASDNEARLLQFLKHSSVTLVPIMESTSAVYAELKQHLRKQGTPIPENDIWIAASTIEHGCVLATGDQHFEYLPQVRTLDGRSF